MCDNWPVRWGVQPSRGVSMASISRCRRAAFILVAGFILAGALTRPAAAGLAVPVALIGMYEGPYTGFLANFTDSDTARMPSDYTASIRWSDDGTTSAGPSDLALCLGGGRFRVQASWQTAGAGGAGGSGHAMPLTDGTGTFWFFAPDNVELIVKV